VVLVVLVVAAAAAVVVECKDLLAFDYITWWVYVVLNAIGCSEVEEICCGLLLSFFHRLSLKGTEKKPVR
jgi:hypothetical protein